MTFLWIVFFVLTMMFLKSSLEGYNEKNHHMMKAAIITAVITLLVVLIGRKTIAPLAMVVLHVVFFVLFIKMMKSTKKFKAVMRKCIRLYITGQLLGLATVVAWLAKLIC